MEASLTKILLYLSILVLVLVVVCGAMRRAIAVESGMPLLIQ